MHKQVDKSHYGFERYMRKARWASIWHQVHEVARLKPSRVLEVGPGPGVFKAVMGAFDFRVETLDLDPELHPDYVASVFEMPFDDGAFDVVCAFQMLEHLPFEQSLQAFREMARVTHRSVIISLPDAATRWPVSVHVPTVGRVEFSVPWPRLRAPVHQFNGEHHWEINTRGYPLDKVTELLSEAADAALERTFRVPDNPYHRFFVFRKTE